MQGWERGEQKFRSRGNLGDSPFIFVQNKAENLKNCSFQGSKICVMDVGDKA